VLQFYDTDVEIDCKRVVDGLHGKRTLNSDFGVLLSDCRILLSSNLVNSNINSLGDKQIKLFIALLR
jgi:hypothetical protein